MPSTADRSWFRQAAYGLFIHWGPYARFARGEQVIFRELIDQKEYQRAACRWNPRHYNAAEWAQTAVRAGMKYAVLTTRHHDGYCLWDTKTTDYSSVAQAPKRDFVREYVDAMRAAGLRVVLYYSLADMRLPAYWAGPRRDPQGWERFIRFVHDQIRELMTNYGKIDVLWFDGNWPAPCAAWRGREMIQMVRQLQPTALINERLSVQEPSPGYADPNAGAEQNADLGDFSTPEQHVTADPNRIWESCNTSTWRLWGFTKGEQWHTTEYLLDLLVDAASKGGNLILNVGPDEHGRIPKPFKQRMDAIGQWLQTHGEAIYGTQPGDICEFITYGKQTRRDNNLYLVIRFWHGGPTLRLSGLETRVKSATLLTTGQTLEFTQDIDSLVIEGLPRKKPCNLFPVIKLECDGAPTPRPWAKDRLWNGDAGRMTFWSQRRGAGVMVDGKWGQYE